MQLPQLFINPNTILQINLIIDIFHFYWILQLFLFGKECLDIHVTCWTFLVRIGEILHKSKIINFIRSYNFYFINIVI